MADEKGRDREVRQAARGMSCAVKAGLIWAGVLLCGVALAVVVVLLGGC